MGPIEGQKCEDLNRVAGSHRGIKLGMRHENKESKVTQKLVFLVSKSFLSPSVLNKYRKNQR